MCFLVAFVSIKDRSGKLSWTSAVCVNVCECMCRGAFGWILVWPGRRIGRISKSSYQDLSAQIHEGSRHNSYARK